MSIKKMFKPIYIINVVCIAIGLIIPFFSSIFLYEGKHFFTIFYYVFLLLGASFCALFLILNISGFFMHKNKIFIGISIPLALWVFYSVIKWVSGSVIFM